MQPTFRVVVNRTSEHRIATSGEADALCNELAELPVFLADVYTGQGCDPCLDVLVESGQAHTFYMDMARGIKLGSRDQTCTQRGIVSLRNDAYPELELDQMEVQRRSLISPDRAIAILRHYLKTGEPIDMVPWPSPDESEWDGEQTPDNVRLLAESGPRFTGEEIPF